MPFLYLNQYGNPATTIDGAIDNAVTSLVVTTLPPGVTGGDFPIVVVEADGVTNKELMLVTGISGSGSKTWAVSRAIGADNPSSPVSHSDGARVYLVQTKESLEALSDWANLTSKPSTFAPSTHGNTAHTTTGTPGSSAVGDTAAQGSSASVARLDHVHGREAFATPTDLGNSNSAGSASTIPHSDHVHKRTVRVKKAGVDVGTRNAVNFIEGTNVTLTVADNSGSDQVDVTINSSGGGGGSSTLAGDTDVTITSPSNEDGLQYVTADGKWENKPRFDATSPTTQALGDSPVVGTAATAARRDHKHGMPTSLASDKKVLTSGNVSFTSTSFAVISTSLNITITTEARRCLIGWTVAAKNSSGSQQQVDVEIDGSRVGQTLGLVFQGAGALNENANLSGAFLTDVLSAASHTFKLFFRVDGGASTIYASTTITPIVFWAQEVL